MSKVVLLCCILLPVVCHGTCAPGEDSCNMMDEAALVQKDVSLAQKGTQNPADIDRATVAKHISEALSLQYLGQSNEAKLKQAKQLLEEFKGNFDAIDAAAIKYKNSKHSEEDFEMWYDAVSEGVGKTVKSIGLESKISDADVAEMRKDLDHDWERFEEATTYADKVTKLAVASQLSGQASWIGKNAKKQNDQILNAMEAYQQETKDGFVNKKFGETLTAIKVALYAIRGDLDAAVMINERKVQEVKDAKSQYTSRAPEDLNKALFQLIAMDKAKSRTEVAQNVDFGFKPREAEYIQALTKFSQSKRTKEDEKAFRSAVEEVLETTESMVKTMNDADKKGEKETKDVILKAFENLSDEGELAQKLVKFGTHWGRQRLQSDLIGAVLKEQGNLKTAFDTYEKSFETGDQDKEFGKCYNQIMVTLVTLKGTFSSWVEMGAFKENELKDNNLQLNAWLKQ